MDAISFGWQTKISICNETCDWIDDGVKVGNDEERAWKQTDVWRVPFESIMISYSLLQNHLPRVIHTPTLIGDS